MSAFLFLELTLVTAALALLLALVCFGLPGRLPVWRERDVAVSADELATLYGALRELTNSLAPVEIMEELARQLTAALEASGAWIVAVDRRTYSLIFMAEYKAPDRRADGEILPLGRAIRGADLPAAFESVKLQQIVWRRHGSSETALASQPFLHQRALYAALIVPLMPPGQMPHAAIIWERQQRPAWTRAQQRMAAALVEQAATALANAGLFQMERRAGATAAALLEISEALSQAADMAEVLQLTLREALQLVNCDQGCMILLDPHSNALYIEAQIGLSEDHQARFNGRQLRPVDGTFAYAIDRGELLEIPDTAADPRVLYDPSCPPPGQLTQVPLKTAQGTIGVIALSCLPADDRDRFLLRALAALAAAAIEKARLIADLQQLATTDDVTGLYNRRHFLEVAGREIGRAQRYGRPLAAVLFDIDHFKQFNDSYGHATGDEVLRAVAARCRQALRDVDLLARYGGEELVVLLPESTVDDAARVAERLRVGVADSPIYTRCGPLNVTISLGVAALTPDCAGVAALVDRADAAMYRAKQAGRNRVAF
jgi:diguanylate cyclase (GGDEF)-like protein